MTILEVQNLHKSFGTVEVLKNISFSLEKGSLFQSFNLFPQYTVLKNVMLAKELLAEELPEYKTQEQKRI